MKATIIATDIRNINANHRKESNFREEYNAFYVGVDGQLHTLVTLRIYATESRAYACCWLSSSISSVYSSGSGYAGGYGYHRASAAAEEAINKAGVKLSEDINGRGDSAILEAVKAVGEELTFGRFPIYTHHSHA
jgi:hypothetical protein